MRTLCFAADGQKLSQHGDFRGIVSGTKGYLRCHFKFNADWSGCKKAAVFMTFGNEVPVPVDAGGCCNVPDAVTDAKFFYVKLVGARNNGYRITTNKVLIQQEV